MQDSEYFWIQKSLKRCNLWGKKLTLIEDLWLSPILLVYMRPLPQVKYAGPALGLPEKINPKDFHQNQKIQWFIHAITPITYRGSDQ